MQIDHVGIATADAEALTSLYEDLFGLALVHAEEFNGLSIAFLDCGNGYLEVLEPLEEGTVSRYLERNGPGIHHLAFETDDIDEALATARRHGVELVDSEPRPGAWGHDVAFLHPRDTGGILIEFVEH